MYCTDQFGSINNRGYLIEILNQQQQQVLVNLSSTNNTYIDEYYWIGLQYIDSKYVWTTGDETSYTEDISILTDANSFCVAVDKEGNWLGLDCRNNYSYVCQRRKNLCNRLVNILCNFSHLLADAPPSVTELICLQNSTTPVCVTLLVSVTSRSVLVYLLVV